MPGPICRFLVDAGLPRVTAEVLLAAGHDVVDVRDIGPASMDDEQVALIARMEQRCLLTRDFDFADVRRYPPAEFEGIVVFAFPERAGRVFIMEIVRAFIDRADILAAVPGRLVVVEPGRIRLRPPWSAE